jgi:hypothetical protein
MFRAMRGKLPVLATITLALVGVSTLNSASAQRRGWGSTHYGVDLNRAPNPGMSARPIQRPPVATAGPLRGGAVSAPNPFRRALPLYRAP